MSFCDKIPAMGFIRAILVFLFLSFLSSFAIAGEAEVQYYQNKIESVRKNIIYLKKKLNSAQKSKNKKRTNTIKKDIKKQYVRLKNLYSILDKEKKDIAYNPLPPEPPVSAIPLIPSTPQTQPLTAEVVPVAKAKDKKIDRSGIGASLSYRGGGGAVGLSYGINWGRVDLVPEAGYGVGNNYTFSFVRIPLKYKIGDYNTLFVGFALAGYSNAVEGIPGMPERVEKGNISGLEFGTSSYFENYEIGILYSVPLGISLYGGYKF